jgi:hypothetical protein
MLFPRANAIRRIHPPLELSQIRLGERRVGGRRNDGRALESLAAMSAMRSVGTATMYSCAVQAVFRRMAIAFGSFSI